ncbi:MAG: DUF1491 family protein [Caulobacterales bacterium]|nr:DUF1491 family protein [Caulobacterales bacterium]
MITDLKTSIWVSALIKRAEIGGAFGYVIRKGDVDNGSVIVKIQIDRENSKLLIPSRDLSGNLIFVDITSNIIKNTNENKEQQIETYIKKRINQDLDIWVIEIEDKNGRDFLIERTE